MIEFDVKCVDLFSDYVANLVDNGWQAKRVSNASYELVSPADEVFFGSCYIEQYLNYDRYSVSLKLGDNLCGCGTVAKVDGVWQAYNLDGETI